ncbi:hypothetical protein F2Q68_00008009 [Brassica cretica]|uniref:Uncharacterized protein n=1 Tax=Brassica cretica TaxID=69181 RepID=A0A8S9KN64_BRACR|nr:hypothetical protein F2Q68_00008009 [Brassica cretica]
MMMQHLLQEERTEQPASSEVTAPDEPIEIPPVQVYVPKVSYPFPPKHLMDPISVEQLAGFRKMPASSNVTAPDEPIEILPVRVYVPKVPYPISPKHLMDPISAEQLDGSMKMARRLLQNISFEHAWEIRPLHMFFKNCRESEEEIKALFTEALTPSLKVMPKVDDPGKFIFPFSIAGVEFKEALLVSGEQLDIVPKKELGKNGEIKEVLDGNPHTDTKKLMRSKKSWMEILTRIPRNSVGMQSNGTTFPLKRADVPGNHLTIEHP